MNIPKKRTHVNMNLVLICVGICASAIMFWTMANGPGISPDSTIYFAVAKNILAGNGFYYGEFSVAHYPPLYSILLAIVGLFNNGDLLQAARLLHAALFGINLCLIIFVVQKCTNNSFWASIFAALIFLFSAPLILIYSMGWSESSFTIFSLGTLILLSYYSRKPSTKWLVVTSIVCGLAIATRYIGVVLLPAIAISILFWGNRTVKDKFLDTFIAMVISCFPISVWMVSNLIMTQSATDRTLTKHLFGLEHIKSLIETMYYYIFPIQASDWIQGLLIFGILTVFVFSTFKIFSQKDSYFEANSIGFILLSLCLTFFIMYIAFLMISISFFDAHTPLDFRILAPAYLTLIIAFITLTWRLFQSSEQKIIKKGFLILALVSIILNSRPAISRIIDIHNNGLGYSSVSWRNSEIIHYLKSVPLNENIYTNGVDVLRFWTGKEAMVLPQKIFGTTLRPNQNYKEQIKFLCEDVREGKAIIIYFTNVNRPYLPELGELINKCDISPLMELSDGIIF